MQWRKQEARVIERERGRERERRGTEQEGGGGGGGGATNIMIFAFWEGIKLSARGAGHESHGALGISCGR